jgi:metal-sulfur cluster biosynthetic enzyme
MSRILLPSPMSDKIHENRGSRAEASRIRLQITERLNEIVDPCGLAFGTEIGLVDMGLVPEIEISDDQIVVGLCPTFPGCLFVPSLLKAMTEKLASLETERRLTVRLASDQLAWDPGHMSETARRRLERARNVRKSAARATVVDPRHDRGRQLERAKLEVSTTGSHEAGASRHDD